MISGLLMLLASPFSLPRQPPFENGFPAAIGSGLDVHGGRRRRICAGRGCVAPDVLFRLITKHLVRSLA